jgi:hypothetical protein
VTAPFDREIIETINKRNNMKGEINKSLLYEEKCLNDFKLVSNII